MSWRWSTKVASMSSSQPSSGEKFSIFHERLFLRNTHAPPSIMKARKTMKHRRLIEEVISQISLRFTPQAHDIKKVGNLLCSPLTALNSWYCSEHRRSTYFLIEVTSSESTPYWMRMLISHRGYRVFPILIYLVALFPVQLLGYLLYFIIASYPGHCLHET